MNMMNEQLRNKIEASWSETMTPAQQRELLQLLNQEEELLKEELNGEFENDLVLNLQYLPDQEMQEVFGKICEQLGLENLAASGKQKARRVSIVRWIAAAAAVLIIAIGFYWYYPKQHSPAPLAVNDTGSSMETWQNDTNEEQVRLLDDGSRIVLSPGSELRYLKHFDADKRLITLTGKASFEVAKDSTRPFTVYAGNLATTALGTRFLIDMSDSSTQVKLFEGKVVVRDTAQNSLVKVYLLPGEQLNFDNVHRQLINEEVAIPASVAKNTKADPAVPKIKLKDLEFAQTPIIEVFNALAKRYKVRFEYDENQISQELVTGKFMADEQLNTILKILETINGFSFQRKGNTIIVTK
jgi:transmembrane sensor